MKAILALAVLLILGACISRPAATRAGATERPHCLRETGSRIEPDKDGCMAASGRSYSQQDLRRTGMATTAEAIERKLP